MRYHRVEWPRGAAFLHRAKAVGRPLGPISTRAYSPNMDLKIACDDDDLRISFRDAGSRVAVVAFTGIGHRLGGIQTEEFKKSLADGNPSTIFVIDKKRRWYNHGLSARVIDTVNGLLIGMEAAEKVVTLGNSMGGFGAVAFAGRLRRCTTAIAFCPQSSAHPEIASFDCRWMDLRSEITDWDFPDAAPLMVTHVRYHIFFGAKDHTDGQHAARLSGASNVSVNAMPGCGHGTAAFMKQQGTLYPTIRKLIWPTRHRWPWWKSA